MNKTSESASADKTNNIKDNLPVTEYENVNKCYSACQRFQIQSLSNTLAMLKVYLLFIIQLLRN